MVDCPYNVGDLLGVYSSLSFARLLAEIPQAMTPEQIIPRLLWLLDHPWVIWVVILFWLLVGMFYLLDILSFPMRPRRK